MKKKIITFTMICAILLSLTGCASTKLNVKEENVTVEYGEEVSTDIENEDGKTYPSVGEYEIVFSYEKQEAKVDVAVIDTDNAGNAVNKRSN